MSQLNPLRRVDIQNEVLNVTIDGGVGELDVNVTNPELDVNVTNTNLDVNVTNALQDVNVTNLTQDVVVVNNALDTVVNDWQQNDYARVTGQTAGWTTLSVGGVAEGVNQNEQLLSPTPSPENFLLIAQQAGEACSFALEGNENTTQFVIEYYATSASPTATTVVLTSNGTTPVSIGTLYRIKNVTVLPTSPTQPDDNFWIARTADGFINGVPVGDPVYFMKVAHGIGGSLIYYQPINTYGVVDSVVMTSDQGNNDNYLLKLVTESPLGIKYERPIYFGRGVQVIPLTNLPIMPQFTVYATVQRVSGNGSSDISVQLNITQVAQ